MKCIRIQMKIKIYFSYKGTRWTIFINQFKIIEITIIFKIKENFFNTFMTKSKSMFIYVQLKTND